MDSLLNINDPKQRKLLTTIALFLAIALLLWVISSGLYYTVYGLKKDRKISNRAPVKVSQLRKPTRTNINQTINRNLFGKKAAVVAKAPQKVIPKNAPETKLDLSLKGLLSATNPKTARAIISVKKKKGKLYSVGESLEGANGVTIEEIKPDGVLINRNGVIENLALVKKKSSGKNSLFSFSSPNSPGNNVPRSRRAGNNQASFNRARSNSNVRRNSSGRRAIKAPSSSQFKGLDAAIERDEIDQTLEAELEQALLEIEM